jgi:hypothetical protein
MLEDAANSSSKVYDANLKCNIVHPPTRKRNPPSAVAISHQPSLSLRYRGRGHSKLGRRERGLKSLDRTEILFFLFLQIRDGDGKKESACDEFSSSESSASVYVWKTHADGRTSDWRTADGRYPPGCVL